MTRPPDSRRLQSFHPIHHGVPIEIDNEPDLANAGWHQVQSMHVAFGERPAWYRTDSGEAGEIILIY